MKKYRTCWTNRFLLFSLSFLLLCVMGGLLLALGCFDRSALIGSIILCGVIALLFLCCFFAERTRFLLMDESGMTLPPGTTKNNIRILTRTTIPFAEIVSVKCEYIRTCTFFGRETYPRYVLTRTDGTRIEFAPNAYGKQAEAEILATIRSHITRRTV